METLGLHTCDVISHGGPNKFSIYKTSGISTNNL